MRKGKILLIAMFCVGFISCIKQSPQLPSNKVIVINTENAALLRINKSLTNKEDSLIRILAERKKSFKKNNIGFWYRIFKSGKGALVTDSAICSFDFQLSKLDEKQIQAGHKVIIIGKKQSVTGLEEGLKMMHKGDSATFIIPWYLAYGMTGDGGLIPPYTSLIYKLKLNN
ncbi:MAG: FKBP-type peptidyl-prolyl cis-trans isomerase [Paludibacter sp.]|jgi:FKBP-type peptidyl-prolyl cis-trans isomerase FkpA